MKLKQQSDTQYELVLDSGAKFWLLEGREEITVFLDNRRLVLLPNGSNSVKLRTEE